MVVFYNDFLISHLGRKPERKMTEPFLRMPSTPTEINLGVIPNIFNPESI